MSNKVTVYPSCNDIAAPFPALLLDAYGVFWGGNASGLIKNCDKAMQKFVDEGKILGILSNSTQAAEKEIQKLEKSGLKQGVHYHFLLTSGTIAKEIIKGGFLPFDTPRNTYCLTSANHPSYTPPAHLFEGTAFVEVKDLMQADFIYCSIPHINGEDQTDPEVFREEMEAILIRRGDLAHLPMVCANPDRFAHEGAPPRMVVRQGSVAAIYEELGAPVFYIGKPSFTASIAAMEKFRELGIDDPSKVLMVGDTPETDIRGANRFGMQSALILTTGMTAERISQFGLEKTLADMTDLDIPDFFIERFT